MLDTCTVCFLDKVGKTRTSLKFPESTSISIHSDDTIQTIKEKICYGTRDQGLESYSLEEMYLFAVVERPFVLLDWYKQVTQNESIPLTHERFGQVLVNLASMTGDTDDELLKILQNSNLEEKTVMRYEDLNAFPWLRDKKVIQQKVPLGIRMEISLAKKNAKTVKRTLPVDDMFVANPHDLQLEMRELYDRKSPVVLDKEFLFHYSQKSVDNTIYVVLADDVLEDIDNGMSQYYFPLLYKKDIKTRAALRLKRPELLEKTQSRLESNVAKYREMDMYYRAHQPYTFSQEGIESFSLNIENNQYFQSNVRMPLEAIFKNIHASDRIPFIQFVGGKRQDHMVRLHAPDISKTGEKIPSLSPKLVLSISKQTLGRPPYMMLYVRGTENITHIDEFLKIRLEGNGNIKVKGYLPQALGYSDFEAWLKGQCNFVFGQINEFLMQSGYSIRLLDSLTDPFINIFKITYRVSLELRAQFHVRDHLQALSPLLATEPKPGATGESYRYKRVEHFYAMNEEEEFISQLLKLTQDKKMVEHAMKMRFRAKSEREIRAALSEYSDKYRTIHGRFINKKSEALAHAGFPMVFQRDFDTLTVRVSDIDRIEYIVLIRKYLESIMRLSQTPEGVDNKWLAQWNESGGVLRDEPSLPVTESAQEEGPSLLATKVETNEEGTFLGDDEEDGDEEEVVDEEEFVEALDDFLEEDDPLLYEKGDAIEEPTPEEPVDVDEELNQKEKNNDDDEEEFSFGGAAKTGIVRGYFTKRIESRDPKLYGQIKSGYSRVCAESQRRQPIIITQEEKDEYDAKYKGYNDDDHPYGNQAMQYNSDGSKPMYYICPRFWCTQTGQVGPMTEEEVKSGKCGKIITDTGKPKEGEHVYSRDYTTYTGNRLRKNPAFVSKTGPDGKEICYPCCFLNVDEGKKAACLAKEGKKKEAAKPMMKQVLMYVLGYNRREALEPGRVGIIPIPVQQFMNVDSSTCIEDGDERMVKPNCPVLLRVGVENTPNHNQSFLACMADLYAKERSLEKTPKLEEFRNTVVAALSLDVFVQLQNGTLVSQFSDKKVKMDDVSIDGYKDQKLYQNLDKREESQLSFLKHCIMSYELFCSYLRQPDAKLDHMLLWDVVTRPLLFAKGLNLAIFEIMQDDMTNKVNLVCPTSHFHPPLYDPQRPTVFMLKNETLYEPIYQVSREETKLHFKSHFTLKEKHTGDMGVILKMIQQLVDQQCKPSLTRTKTFMFKENLPVITLYKALQSLGMEVEHRVVNYQAKTIGLTVPYKGATMYVPCFPSTSPEVDEITKLKWMDDGSLWTDYDRTVTFLRELDERSEGKIKIPCKPVFRIVEDGMIVGVLTHTNQFVQINPPLQNVKKDLKEFKASNYLVTDKKLMNYSETTNPLDPTIQAIHLENQFYNAFRTTMRILMRFYKYRDLTEKMNALCHNTEKSNRRKRKYMAKYLRRIGDKHVEFQVFDSEVLNKLQQVFTCETNAENKQYCVMQEGSDLSGKLLIPERHLVTGEDNDMIYYTRLADELLRHRRVHLFMFYPDQYLNIQSQDYQINEDELVAPKSLLQPEYFEKLKKHPHGAYGRTVPYENADVSDMKAKTVNWYDLHREADRD